MNIESLELIVKGESSARGYLKNACWKNYRFFCIRCNSKSVIKLRRDKYRCQDCGYEFGCFTGRWLSKLHISFRDWLWPIKLFEIAISAMKASQQLGLSYPTVLKGFNIIRKAITSQSQNGNLLLQGEIKADESYFGGRRKGPCGRGSRNKTPVFGILERKGLVKVTVVNNVSARELITHTVKTVRRGSIIYTDNFRSYDSLMFCGYRHLTVDHRKQFAHGKVYINGLEGFWSYAKERLIQFHGVSKEKFPYYLKKWNSDIIIDTTQSLNYLSNSYVILLDLVANLPSYNHLNIILLTDIMARVVYNQDDYITRISGRMMAIKGTSFIKHPASRSII